jgi:CTD kinase subunit beta
MASTASTSFNNPSAFNQQPPSSLIKHHRPYFSPAEVASLSTKQRGKLSERAEEKSRQTACSFAENVGGRMGLYVACCWLPLLLSNYLASVCWLRLGNRPQPKKNDSNSSVALSSLSPLLPAQGLYLYRSFRSFPFRLLVWTSCCLSKAHQLRYTYYDAQDVVLACLYVSCKLHDTLKKPREIVLASFAVRFPELLKAKGVKGGMGVLGEGDVDPVVRISRALLDGSEAHRCLVGTFPSYSLAM